MISGRAWSSRVRWYFICTLLVLLARAPARAGDRFDSVRETIRNELERSGVPSLAVGVSRKDEILWTEAFGWADREQRIPATSHTPYSIASVTKPFTATALMLLAEQGLIRLDRPVNQYLGTARLRARIGRADEATVRRVANHTAGLPLHHHFFPENEPYRPPPLVETIRRYGNLVTPPGERYQYSNLGYGVLEHVIERVSGRDYPLFMKEEIFRPLELEHTSVALSERQARGSAVRYGPAGRRIPFYDFDHRGASAVFSCVEDLLRFAMLHLRVKGDLPEAFLSDDAIEQMQKPGRRRDDGSAYGLGWIVRDSTFGYRKVMHTGGMGGVSASLVLVPAYRLAVVVLANARTGLVGRISEDILAKLLPLHTSRRAGAAVSLHTRTRSSESSDRPPRNLCGTWKGAVETYQATLPLTLTVTRDRGIRGQLGKQPQVTLERMTFREDRLSAWMKADIGTEDANRHPNWLRVSLTVRGHSLSGTITAFTDAGPLSSALSYWVKLQKVPRTAPGS